MTKEPVSDAIREFGERVRARRHALGWSQEVFADHAGVHWSYIGQIERGQRDLRLHNILRLAEALRLDPAELVKGLRAPTG